MNGTITDVPGLLVGHAQDMQAITGCTVVLCETGAAVAADVRGWAPGTRETDLARPGMLVGSAHAILLTGGSAFGLDAAGGVMGYLRDRGVGFPTGVMPVPIVPAAVLFDLGIGLCAWPDADMALRACLVASDEQVEQGSVGAGTGATVGKALGTDGAMKSGIGSASMVVGRFVVGAIVAVNAFGDVVDPSGKIIAGARTGSGWVDTEHFLLDGPANDPVPGNTTIGVVATNASLDTSALQHLTAAAHDGLARCIRPVHTSVDGDTIFALATDSVSTPTPPEQMAVAVATTRAVEQAVRAAVHHAFALGGLPACADLTSTGKAKDRVQDGRRPTPWHTRGGPGPRTPQSQRAARRDRR